MTLSPLGRRLFIALLIISSAVTFISSATILWFDYNQGQHRYENILKQISVSYKDSVSYSLWAYDTPQIEAQLQGIMNFPGVVYVQIDNNGEIINQQGDLYHPVTQSIVVPLEYQSNGKNRTIGFLRVSQSYQSLYESLRARAFDIIISQLFLFLAVTFSVLLVLHRLVTRRLGLMAKWAFNFSLDNLDNELSINGKQTNDEFSQVAEAINHMRLTLKEDLRLRELERLENIRLHQQLTLAVDNASLGFCRYTVSTDSFDGNHHFANQLGTNELELKHQGSALDLLLNQISGERAAAQKEQIKLLLKGNLTTLNDTYILQTPTHFSSLDISFQTVSYIENCPEKILIYSTNRTEEFNLKNKIDLLLTENNQQEKNQIDLLKNDNQKLREEKVSMRREIRRLRIGQQPKHIQALSQLILGYLGQWQTAIKPEDFKLWHKFLTLDFYQSLTPIDISTVFKTHAATIAKQYDVMFQAEVPFSLIAEEDSTILEFFMLAILPPSLLEHANSLKLTIQLKGNELSCCWDYHGNFNDLNLDDLLALKLANIITHMRYSGQITYKKSDEQLVMLLTAPFRT